MSRDGAIQISQYAGEAPGVRIINESACLPVGSDLVKETFVSAVIKYLLSSLR